ncbi:MAG: zinc ribbon domain-containing protein [Deltaproteobacteria bacterium]|nr:zinc ribbon domain-containing protein [Deltaproteobacteria bacterium]
MHCPKCRFEQTDTNTECPKCGIIFAKYRKTPPPSSAVSREEGVFKRLLLDVETEYNAIAFWGRVVILLALAVLSWKFAVSSFSGNDNPGGFMHFVNLPFHEAGHILFRPLGSFMTSLGGSLGQLLMPLVCVAAFLFFKRDAFAASVCMWWFGENFVDLAPYIGDARRLALPLLGGNTGADSPYGFHDWEYILTEIGWLGHDHAIATAARLTGVLLMGLSVVWGGYVLFRIHTRRVEEPGG